MKILQSGNSARLIEDKKLEGRNNVRSFGRAKFATYHFHFRITQQSRRWHQITDPDTVEGLMDLAHTSSEFGYTRTDTPALKHTEAVAFDSIICAY